MKNKYFDDFTFKNIKKLVIENRLDVALSKCEEYIEKYPNDNYALLYYVDILIRINRIDDAEMIFNSIDISTITFDLTQHYAELINLKLLSCRCKYEKCLEIVRENYDIFEEREWYPNELLIYFKKKLGLLVDVDYSEGGYRIAQITNYNEEDAINCIKHYHFLNFEDDIPPAYFSDDFRLEEVFSNIRSILPLDNKYNNHVIENHYIFKYDNCGKVNNRIVDYIKVIALINSNDIITMYPHENKEMVDCVDLTPTIKDNPKQKRLSQIDKFNKRYPEINKI